MHLVSPLGMAPSLEQDTGTGWSAPVGSSSFAPLPEPSRGLDLVTSDKGEERKGTSMYPLSPSCHHPCR